MRMKCQSMCCWSATSSQCDVRDGCGMLKFHVLRVEPGTSRVSYTCSCMVETSVLDNHYRYAFIHCPKSACRTLLLLLRGATPAYTRIRMLYSRQWMNVWSGLRQSTLMKSKLTFVNLRNRPSFTSSQVIRQTAQLYAL